MGIEKRGDDETSVKGAFSGVKHNASTTSGSTTIRGTAGCSGIALAALKNGTDISWIRNGGGMEFCGL